MEDSLLILKQFIVVFLLICPSLICNIYKKMHSGIVFLVSALLSSFFGILPSQLIFHSIFNKSTLTLFSLYVVFRAATKTGVIAFFLESIQKYCRGKPVWYYLACAGLASFFPFQNSIDIIVKQLKHKISIQKTSLYPIFPALFAAASSLTLIGSVTNLLSDHICNQIFLRDDWGFFSNGPISLTLFLVCFFFYLGGIRSQNKNEKAFAFAGVTFDPFATAQSLEHKAEKKSLDVFQSFDETITSDVSTQKFLDETQKNTKNWIKDWIFFAFFILILLSVVGIPIFYSAPFCAALLILVKALNKNDDFACFPKDVFFLFIAATIFCHVMRTTGLAGSIAPLLSFLKSKISLVTFFLFSSAILSIFIPSLIVVSVMLSIINFLPSASDPSFLQFLAAAVTFGSFFLLASKDSLKKVLWKSELIEDPAKIKIRATWTLAIYFVFITHTVLFYMVD